MGKEQLILNLISVLANLELQVAELKDRYGSEYLQIRDMNGHFAATPMLAALANGYAALAALSQE